jgi:hypothetical protein
MIAIKALSRFESDRVQKFIYVIAVSVNQTVDSMKLFEYLFDLTGFNDLDGGSVLNADITSVSFC